MTSAAGRTNDLPEPEPQAASLSRPAAETLARTLKAMADPTRLQLLSMITGTQDGRATVKELFDQLDLTQPTVSHHLRVMFDEGILEKEQQGRNVWYSIAESYRDSIADLLR